MSTVQQYWIVRHTYHVTVFDEMTNILASGFSVLVGVNLLYLEGFESSKGIN